MTGITIRQATPSDLDTIARLKSVAFGGDEAAVRANLEDNPRYNYRHIIVAEMEEQVVGTATVIPTQMWLSGVPVTMGAVAGVTTDPRFRRRGVFRAMMEHLIPRMHAENFAISALFPADHDLYTPFGYAPAAIWHAYSIRPDNLPRFPEAAHVRPFDPADLPTLRSIYRGGQLSQADGRLTRSAAWWERLVAEKYRTGSNRIVVYDEDGVAGYLKFRLSEENVLHVAEMLAHSDAAYRGLWGYMATLPHVAAIEYVAPADDPIFHLLRKPADRHGGNRGWIFDDIYHATASFMLRIIHLSEALTARFYPHNMMGHRILKIHDSLLPANEQSLKFRIVDGRPETRPADDAPADIETDIATFSQIYCGFLAPETARRLGRLRADDESVAWLGRAMQTRPLYMHSGDWF